MRMILGATTMTKIVARCWGRRSTDGITLLCCQNSLRFTRKLETNKHVRGFKRIFQRSTPRPASLCGGGQTRQCHVTEPMWWLLDNIVACPCALAPRVRPSFPPLRHLDLHPMWQLLCLELSRLQKTTTTLVPRRLDRVASSRLFLRWPSHLWLLGPCWPGRAPIQSTPKPLGLLVTCLSSLP